MTFTPGLALASIGVVHCLVGLAVGLEPLQEIVADGVFAAVNDDQPWRMAIFWFEQFGILLLIIGAQWHWMDRHGGAPRWVGAAVLAMCATGIVCMPASGFWLAVPVGIWGLVRGAPSQSAAPG